MDGMHDGETAQINEVHNTTVMISSYHIELTNTSDSHAFLERHLSIPGAITTPRVKPPGAGPGYGADAPAGSRAVDPRHGRADGS